MMEFPGLGKLTEMFIVSHVHFLHYTSTRKIMKLLLQCVCIHAAGYWIGMYVYLLIVNYVVQEYCVVVADKYKMSSESCWICI